MRARTTKCLAGQREALGKTKVVARTYIPYIHMQQKDPGIQLDPGHDRIETKTVRQKVRVLQCKTSSSHAPLSSSSLPSSISTNMVGTNMVSFGYSCIGLNWPLLLVSIGRSSPASPPSSLPSAPSSSMKSPTSSNPQH